MITVGHKSDEYTLRREGGGVLEAERRQYGRNDGPIIIYIDAKKPE